MAEKLFLLENRFDDECDFWNIYKNSKKSLVRTFDMNRRIFQNSALYYAQSLQRKFMIEFISPDQIRAISDIAITIVQGRVAVNNVHRQKRRHYKRTIRFLAYQRISTNREKRTILAFHDVIPLLIKPILHLLDEQ